MYKYAIAVLAGLPTYALLGAMDVSMTQAADRAIAANRPATATVVATAPRVIELPRVEIVGTRIHTDVVAKR